MDVTDSHMDFQDTTKYQLKNKIITKQHSCVNLDPLHIEKWLLGSKMPLESSLE